MNISRLIRHHRSRRSGSPISSDTLTSSATFELLSWQLDAATSLAATIAETLRFFHSKFSLSPPPPFLYLSVSVLATINSDQGSKVLEVIPQCASSRRVRALLGFARDIEFLSNVSRSLFPSILATYRPDTQEDVLDLSACLLLHLRPNLHSAGTSLVPGSLGSTFKSAMANRNRH